VNESTRVVTGDRDEWGRINLRFDAEADERPDPDTGFPPYLVIRLDSSGQFPEALVEQVAEAAWRHGGGKVWPPTDSIWGKGAPIERDYLEHIRAALTSLLSPSTDTTP
jgi:hypothetical protein